mgnify:CR=1 FL=1
MNLSKTVIGLAVSTALASPSIYATEQNDLAIERVVVTAQKRQQNLQEVPISVSALNSEELKQANVVSLSNMASIVPGLNISNTQAEETSITMRGIGSNDFGFSSDESIPIYLDGVYLGSGIGAISDLIDIAQIEVLKGPQGSLFGRNAVGGAVNITTTKPSSDLEANVSVGRGNYNLNTVQGMINAPLVDDELSLRMTAGIRKRDGWQYNEALDKDDGYEQDRWNARGKLRWTPSEQLDVELTFDANEESDNVGYSNIARLAGRTYVHSKVRDIVVADTLDAYRLLSSSVKDVAGTTSNNNSAYLAFDFSDPQNPFPLFDGPLGNSVNFGLNRKNQGVALKVDWEISDSLSFSSVSSYRTFESEISEDSDGSEFLVLNVRSLLDSKEFNQEFRISGKSETIDWFVGVNAFKSDVEGKVVDSFGAIITGEAFDETAIVDADTTSYALFGDAIWSVTDNTNVTFGIRASYDKKSQQIKNPQEFGLLFASPYQFLGQDGQPEPSLANNDKSWNDISPRLVVDHKISSDTLLFAGISQGYKSGGFNSFPTVDINPASDTFGFVPYGSTAPFDEEKITNYEAGVKSILLDSRLKLNASAFYYDFTDLQFLVNQGAAVKAINAGSANGKGLELEVQYLLTENLTLNLNSTWLNASYGEDVVDSNGITIVSEGQELAYSPNLSANFSIDHYLEFGELGELRTHLNYAYNGEQYHSSSSNDAIYQEQSKGQLNARISFISAEQTWQVSAWASNLTNEDTLESIGSVTDDFGFIPARRGEPRMFGVEFSYFY